MKTESLTVFHGICRRVGYLDRFPPESGLPPLILIQRAVEELRRRVRGRRRSPGVYEEANFLREC